MEIDGTVVIEDGFGFVPRNSETESDDKSFNIVRRYTMTNKNAASVRLISWGAGIQSIRVPNARDILSDVAFGFDDMKGYSTNRYVGRIINNVRNRSSNFDVNDCFEIRAQGDYRENERFETVNNRNRFGARAKEDREENEKFDTLDNVNWESCILGEQVIMSYVKRVRTRERFGDMLIQVKYSWTDKNELNINMRATVTESMPVNMTVLCPMNLAGHAAGVKELEDHIVSINTEKFGPSGPGQEWFNRVSKVDPNFYDLRMPTRLKNRIYHISGGGYNHNLRINSPSDRCYRFHARIIHPESGRFMEIYSNKSHLKFSTLNDFPDFEPKHVSRAEDRFGRAGGDVPAEKIVLDDETSRRDLFVRGKDGALYRRHGGFVLSPLNDCSDEFSYWNNIVNPGEIYHHDLSYKFGTKSRDR
ncbi:galactose mutarotase-like [Venturia canescens]|uniref:galactose mutarotase-like n=1 Tax=Venturia canescens TaxID=32260 RepID=UPI001C9C5386|nr:galactose mutarotase-like [Venturia canescens]